MLFLVFLSTRKLLASSLAPYPDSKIKWSFYPHSAFWLTAKEDTNFYITYGRKSVSGKPNKLLRATALSESSSSGKKVYYIKSYDYNYLSGFSLEKDTCSENSIMFDYSVGSFNKVFNDNLYDFCIFFNRDETKYNLTVSGSYNIEIRDQDNNLLQSSIGDKIENYQNPDREPIFIKFNRIYSGETISFKRVSEYMEKTECSYSKPLLIDESISPPNNIGGYNIEFSNFHIQAYHEPPPKPTNPHYPPNDDRPPYDRNHKESSGGLTFAGLIGIIIPCIVCVMAIIGICICVKKKKDNNIKRVESEEPKDKRSNNNDLIVVFALEPTSNEFYQILFMNPNSKEYVLDQNAIRSIPLVGCPILDLVMYIDSQKRMVKIGSYFRYTHEISIDRN